LESGVVVFINFRICEGSRPTRSALFGVVLLTFLVGLSVRQPDTVGAAGISVSPSSGSPGQTITVSGSGFVDTETVNLFFGNITRNITVSGTNWSESITVPSTPGGTLSVSAEGISSGTINTSFTIIPTAALSRNDGSVGSNVNVTGEGFPASQLINIIFGGQSVRSVSSGSNGSFNSSFAVPSVAAGTHSVSIGAFPPISFRVSSTFTLAPNSGPAGTSVQILGTGFGPSTIVNLTIGGVPWQFLVADEDGELTGTLQIPPLAGGSKSITVSGGSGSATFNVTPTILLSEPAGSPGNTIIVTGEGFGANQSGINVSFDNEIISSVASDARGSWTLELTIPPARKGTYFIKASGGGTEQQTSFRVAPGLFINKPQAGPGETVTVSGGGFAPNETDIVLKLGDTTVATGIAANAEGSWDRSFDVPPLPANSYNLTASGSQTSAGSVIAVRLTIITNFAAAAVSLHQDSADGATGIRVGMDRVFDHITGQSIPALLGAFQAQLSYDSSCINILGVRELDFAIAATNIDNSAGLATFNGFATGGALAPAYLGHALTRMVGSVRQNCTVEVAVVDLKDLDGNSVGVSPFTLSLDILRGDARPDGVVDISDVLFIAQYLAGVRGACTATIDATCMHSVNAASVRQDGAFDQTSIADAMFTAQYLVGSIDEFLNLVPSPDVMAELGKAFRLGIGDTAIIASEYLNLTLLDVSEDSRCPADVVCVWEGQATVVADLIARGQRVGSFDLTLRAGNEELATGQAGQYQLTLVGLEPYPISTHPIQPQEYQATLVMYKAE
jgi:hypothetical protein